MIIKLFSNGYSQETPDAMLQVDDSKVVEAKTVIMSASSYFDHVIGEQFGSDKVEYIKAQLDESGILYLDLMVQGQDVYL